MLSFNSEHTTDHLSGLNAQQREAAAVTDGPVLILAGAGSGKTRVITYRIAHLIESVGVRPENILAVTFTNKAAGEMKERINKLLAGYYASGNRSGAPLLSTFHSLCVRILRRDIEKLEKGYTRSFTIYDTDDQQKLIKGILKDMGVGDDKQISVRSVQSAISAAKNRGEDPQLYAAKSEYGDERRELIARVFKAYEQRLQSSNALDFDDLLIRTVQLLRHSAETREYYHQRFRHVMVDEFQDTNGIQYALVRLIVEGSYAGRSAQRGEQLPADFWQNRSLCVVGDVDQCIPAGSLVRTPEGYCQIEELRKGSRVIAASGHSRTLTSSVEKVRKKLYSGPVIEIRTAHGRRLKVTPGHILFGRLRPLPGKYLVYLMYRKDKGYRIGITTSAREVINGKKRKLPELGLLVRSAQEVADKMWVLRVCDSRSEASLYEALFAARYGLPTIIFHNRQRKMNITQEQIDHLYQEIDTRARVQQLFEDFNLFEAYPHVTPKSRFESERFYINLTMFGDGRVSTTCPWGGHRIQFATTEMSLRPLFETAGFLGRPGKKRTWRHESARVRFAEACSVVESMKSLDSRIAVKRNALLVEGARAFAEMPASHFHAGMEVAVYDRGQITEDVVTEVNTSEYQGHVYDLDIANVHNFLCEDFVCHNSIYSFRGSDFNIILGFQNDYASAKVVKLEENYRSTKRILEAANKVIANNTERIDKTLYSGGAEGERIRYAQVFDGDAEARFVVQKIEDHLRREPDLRAAVLYRTNAQSRQFEEACRRAGLSYNLVGGFSFYERAEVKDIIAYLKVALNTHDDIALLRVINSPARGIGKSTLDDLERRARDFGVSYWETISIVIDQNLLPARTVNALKSFREIITRLSQRATSEGEKLSDIVKAAVIDTGYERALKAENTEEAEARLLNLEELVNAAAEAEEQEENLRDFIDHAALVADTDQIDAAAQVTLMTMHAAKGLEFPLVFIVGLEEGIFPHSRSRENQSELEEERRLLYVAITRAEKFLYITHAIRRRVYGEETPAEPSRFLMEFPLELIEDISSGPSWLRFANKTSTQENRHALRVLTSDSDYQVEYDDEYRRYSSGSSRSGSAYGSKFKSGSSSSAYVPPSPPKRTSNYGGKSYNNTDSVREFFARQGKQVDDRPAGESSGPKPVSHSKTSTSGFRANMRVRHAKYGQGLIIRVEGDGEDAKLTVNFPGYGTKKLIAKYAGLEKL